MRPPAPTRRGAPRRPLAGGCVRCRLRLSEGKGESERNGPGAHLGLLLRLLLGDDLEEAVKFRALRLRRERRGGLVLARDLVLGRGELERVLRGGERLGWGSE